MQKTFDCRYFFPFMPLTLVAPKPAAEKVGKSLIARELYRHRKKRRLSKRATAKLLGVHHEVVGMWERGDHEPRIHYMPAIIAFIGHSNWLPDATFGNRLIKFRTLNGWPQEQLADWLGINARTVGRWEEGQLPPPQRLQEIEARLISHGTPGDASQTGQRKRCSNLQQPRKSR